MKKSLKQSSPPPELDLLEILARPQAVLGIDPGLSGAAVILYHGEFCAKRDFKTLVDVAQGVRELLVEMPCDSAVIEAVHAMPGQGVVSMFNFGAAYGVAQGAVWSTRPDLPVTFVDPKKWQNWFRRILGMDPKETFDSAAITAGLFPKQPWLFKRVKDHNTGDACLMALYGLANL